MKLTCDFRLVIMEAGRPLSDTVKVPKKRNSGSIIL